MMDIAELTLEQKAELLTGQGQWRTHACPEAGIESVFLCDGPHGIRREVVEDYSQGIPESLPATCFPPAVAVGSSWDPEVAARLGAALGREARAAGVGVVLGPGVNIKRSPLCGRNFEYFSEDPLVSGVLASAYVQALQAEGVGASVKHFAANNQETDRMRISADIDERTLREIYLPAFERVVTEAHPATVMCSYNRVNGVYASQNRWLLTDLLRAEWRFSGTVISDWGAVVDRVAALAAGLDLEMPGTSGLSARKIVEAVRSGTLDEIIVDQAVARVAQLSRFSSATDDETFDVQAHHALARELAAECVVLLKNDNAVLPLEGPGTIAVIGELAVNPRYQGDGSSRVNSTTVDVPLQEITTLATERGAAVVHALSSDAVEVARQAEVAIVFAGTATEAEGYDRESIDLPADQVELIRAVAAVAKRTVVVLSNGGVVSLEGWHDEVDAIVEGWLLGQASGGALADVLFGVVNPSGRLAESIPLRLEDNPSYLNFPGEAGHVRYGEGVMVGYRYYQTVGRSVRYPFGHGLSYTRFHVDDLTVTATGDTTATATVRVTNIGSRAGKHVVQLYVATTAGNVRRPARELRAFRKVFLEPGQTSEITLELDHRAFAYWDATTWDWVVSPGAYRIQIGADSATIVAETEIDLVGDPIIRELTMESTFSEWSAHPVVGPEFRQSMTRNLPTDQAKTFEQANHEGLAMAAHLPMRQFTRAAPALFSDDILEQLMKISRTVPVSREKESREP
ncbi:beta-glucosidase [Kibdelosporangium aridum]|uniref:Exo-alpha-(1->6)-L-arabinopyranosidase n=1 Tax=Kibdelosporangium aridum TaxID=2030 RepID=A0A1Y5YCC5_KIBAR|nr:glycoside hydrolase family 3 C-terminal domain-containing protein [Kibdelosporangium aridum]SMD27279.1 beta-glucosidase [Kibdelosporangium aridum]